ncbi:SURF1 family protein [Phenylobacterium sp. J426]|uniref:SURF1 family protein n=1 Tax=Phenylobacterium sp. J426 TaxID=2898439 RepID=UPI0021511520|nr:SURF1 family cytochrome oxidase biogenesis protein [Phenylobacterium sp. J426]MCR5873325.1 SURF1 family protein [Phenylobacterium sp. J426]
MTVRRGFPVILTVATAIAFLILVSLGTWQVQRLHWKRDLLRRIEALQAAPAGPIGPALARRAAGQDVDFTRVRVECPGLAAAPYLELYGLREGQAGARLISACAVDAPPYRAVLVDRGFVADTVSSRPPVDPASRAPLTVTGVLRSPDPASRFSPPNRPERWFTRDAQAMAAALGASAPAPVFLMAETPTNPEWKALTPAPVPANISNRHLEYAGTWYGLAAALAGVYAAMLLKRRKS